MAAKPKTKTTNALMTPTGDKKRIPIKVKVPKTENIIFIGSEMHYNSFWLKMMFIGSAYKMASQQMRKANRTVIAYVDEGYTHLEKLAIDNLATQYQAEVKKLSRSADVVNLMNRGRDDYKLLDVFFSAHGLLGKIDLGYKGNLTVQLRDADIEKVPKDAFARHGRLFSYACRTGISVSDFNLGFKTEAAAEPEHSLAQKLANHFDIEVHAFLRRSFYGDVLRDKSTSTAIVEALCDGRKTQGDLQVISIPPEHEGLPHPGLADGHWPLNGATREGTDNFALWRSKGGLSLPTTGDSPTGVGAGMRVFKRRV